MRLIDADALIETISDHVTTVSCCPTADWSFGKTQMKKQAIDDIRNAPTVSGWVSVKDRMPESGKSVLVSCQIKLMSGKHKYYVCEAMYTAPKTVNAGAYDDFDAEYDEETDTYYYPEGWWELIHNWDDYSCVAIADFVTHWMPLPEPPEVSE